MISICLLGHFDINENKKKTKLFPKFKPTKFEICLGSRFDSGGRYQSWLPDRDRDSISGKVYCTSGIPDDQGFLLNDHDMDPGGTLGLFVPATAHVGLCSPLRWRQTIRSEAVWPVAMLGGEGGRGCYRGSKGEVTATPPLASQRKCCS